MSNQTDINLEDITNVHCIGIGGVGVSAIARFFQHRGAAVTGSDASMSPVVKGLREDGIEVTVGHAKDNLPESIDLVVYSIAVPHDNPELASAREREITTLTYPQTLGLVSKDMFTVAVSGTHGKTTTTAMLADVFADSKLDPTVIVGSMLKDSHRNFVPGTDDMFVIEACEYKRSFLQLHPDVLVITNIDTDHLDYFDGLGDIQKAFEEMIDGVADNGAVVCNPQDENVKPVLIEPPIVVDYTDIDLSTDLQVFGNHNRENGRAAVATAIEVGVSEDVAQQAVQNFTGTWRRSQKKGETASGALVYDDYGHHPTEIASTLDGFRERFPDKKIIVIFQPHLFSRTKKLLDEFAGSFSAADEVIILPIYAAREVPDLDISSEDLVAKLQENHETVSFAESFVEARDYVTSVADEEALVITQGAGDVYEIADALVNTT
jgi:UDP-N-acetylmuramate--alanine ligase